MKLGIITVATGKYVKYLDNCLKSFDEKFFPNYEKKFVIGDSDSGYKSPIKNCHIISVLDGPWPMPTLYKFKVINRCEILLSDCDIIFWIDVDLNVISTIDNEEEVFPTSDIPICCVIHCGWTIDGRECECTAFDRNSLSLAYVKEHTTPYHQACLFGGYRDEFFRMSKLLEYNVDEDLRNGIIARYHDESHLNRYFQDHVVKTIPKTYARPVAMGPLEGMKIIHIIK